MKVFITGGTGFIGSHLIDFFIHNNIKVYALIRDPSKLKWIEGLNINYLKGDLLNIPSLPVDTDYVFHIAGFTKAPKSADYYTVNQKGTASLFKSLIRQKLPLKKIIVLSSLAAAGPCQSGDSVKESCTPCPITPYGDSKLQGEKAALKYQNEFPVVIIRVGPVFGPRDHDFIAFFKLIKKGILPKFGSVQKLISMCYVKDLVKAMFLCMHHQLNNGEIINIADPTPYSWDDFGKASSQILGKKLVTLQIPLPLVYFLALISEAMGKIRKKPSIINRDKFKDMIQDAWVADTSKAQQKLSFNPDYSLKQALEETIGWYIKEGWL